MNQDGCLPSERVLVVDDEMVMRLACCRALGRAGFEVCEAKDGLEAVKAIQQMQMDAVLLDLSLPVMSGLELMRVIQLVSPDTEIIAITAFSDSPMVPEIVRNGIGVISKPVNNIRDVVYEVARALIRGSLNRDLTVETPALVRLVLEGNGLALSREMEHDIECAARDRLSPRQVVLDRGLLSESEFDLAVSKFLDRSQAPV